MGLIKRKALSMPVIEKNGKGWKLTLETWHLFLALIITIGMATISTMHFVEKWTILFQVKALTERQARLEKNQDDDRELVLNIRHDILDIKTYIINEKGKNNDDKTSTKSAKR